MRYTVQDIDFQRMAGQIVIYLMVGFNHMLQDFVLYYYYFMGTSHFNPVTIRRAAEERVIIFCLPPNTMHKTHP